MTDDEVKRYFSEYVYGFMFNDLENVIQAKANFGVALMLFSYTEVLGGLANGKLGQERVSKECFEDGLRRMVWNGDASYYAGFTIKLQQPGVPDTNVGPYKVFRCGLAHEYFVKGLATVKNDPRASHDDPQVPGFGWDGAALFVYTNGYRRDLRTAFTQLEVDVLAGGSTRANFEAGVGRVASRVVAPGP
jgi:hypothetical protein